MSSTNPLRAAFAALIVCSSASLASAQRVVTLEGSFPSAGEFTMNPPNACGTPSPSAFVWFIPDFTFACPTALGFTPPPVGLEGDVAFDALSDVTYATDGLTITAYKVGVAVASLPIAPGSVLSLPLTGLGADPVNHRLWITDGIEIAAISLFASGCPGLPTVIVAPFTAINAAVGGFVTDVAWDSFAGTLWTCSDIGAVSNFNVGGGLVTPTSFFFPGNCTMTPPLTGIAFDSAQGTLAITDGVIIERTTTSGLPAPATLYAPNGACTTAPFGGPPSPMAGLAFSPRPLPYDFNCSSLGNSPQIGWTGGTSVSPNPNFGITLSGAQPNSPAFLLLSTAAPCPAPSAGYCLVVAFPVFAILNFTTDATGSVNVPLPIPAFAPPGPFIGASVTSQWIIVPPGQQEATQGLIFTLATP